MPPATATQVTNDDLVRVTRFDFAPGDETGWHRHAMNYVITTLTDCAMLLIDKDGERRVLVPAGSAYRRAEGIKHNVTNDGDAPTAFVEVELKRT